MTTAQDYPDQMSKSAGMAARYAHNKEEQKAIKRALVAAGEGQLFHPKTWDLWAGVDDALFVKALALLSEKEARKLQGARAASGMSWVAAFGASPGKLRALAERGLDPEAAPCLICDKSVEPAIWCCMFARLEELTGLMEAGMAAPAALSAETALALDRSEPRTGAHLLARGSVSWGGEGEPEALSRVVGWLATGADVGTRNAKGFDALKMAIRQGAADVAKALLSNGARLGDRDAKGLDAFELFEKTLKECRVQGIAYRAESLKRLGPVLLAAKEAQLLERVADLGAPAEPGSRDRLRM